MDIFNVLTLIGGLCLFLFGMELMGQGLERRAGNNLRVLLGKLTTNKIAGLFTGLAVTAIIQSSSATTVMVVGFVNSGLMSLKQAINVIMGANIGTTVTAWVLSLAGLESDNVFVQLLKPTSFTPILALIGIIYYMFCKDSKKKDTGTILLGFATLMFGMDTMTDAVSGLADIPEFAELFLLFKNPVLGVLVGAVLTAIIQSSSASVGILQALALTGKVSIGASIPIIMGQNIGTCITAILSSIGANRNAKRAALVHLSFNTIGTITWCIVYAIIYYFFSPQILEQRANMVSIAVCHSAFNVLCTILMLPLSGMLEKIANKLIPGDAKKEVETVLDERLLETPPIALEQCHNLTLEMAECSVTAMKDAISMLRSYDEDTAIKIREAEKRSDKYEDVIGSYLVKLSARQLSVEESNEAAKLLRVIGDFERISDHAINLLFSAEELKDKNLTLSDKAVSELIVMEQAVLETLDTTHKAFVCDDVDIAVKVEPLEEVVDTLKEKMRAHHVKRLQEGNCSIETGFVWLDLLTALERTSDHCSNIAGCVLEMAHNDMNIHSAIRRMKKGNKEFLEQYNELLDKYRLPNV